jgi:dipeptidyl aminopeptidase/acylaminoacyl peptidase
LLPDGHGLLFTVTASRTPEGITTVVQDLATGARTTLLNGYDARYLPGGRLVFTRGRGVFAARFDLERRALAGEPVAMIEDLAGYMVFAVAQFDLSRTGTLVYAPTTVFVPRRLVWVDRRGLAEPLSLEGGLYEDPRISGRGDRVAVHRGDAIWTFDPARPALSRLTFSRENDTPAWSPDGRRVAYKCRAPDRVYGVCWRPADGSGEEERLFSRTSDLSVAGWTPDGRDVVFIDMPMETGHDVGLFSLGSAGPPRPLLNSRFNESGPAVSPDGRWLAYASDESGRREVYVQAFPGLGGKRQVSSDGGDEPVWSRDGTELFYRRGDEMRAVSVGARADFGAGVPRTLFTGRYLAFPQRPDTQYDVAPDGRFLMVERDGPADPPLVMVVDWAEELKARLP